MSHPLQIDDPVTSTAPASDAVELRRLYSVRFVLAAVWAGLFAVTASALSPVSVALLVLYPLLDVAAAVVDLRSSGASRARRPLYVNLVLSLFTAAALAVAAASGVPAVLRVWAAWAIAAGVVQVVVAVRRRGLGGQVAMVLSGSISVLAGAGFAAMASGSAPKLASLAGYAALGGVFFLVSALRLRGPAATTHP